MELWQMDIVGGVKIVGGSEAKIVSGVDDHSRFCISAQVVARATARPTCDALGLAMRPYPVEAVVPLWVKLVDGSLCAAVTNNNSGLVQLHDGAIGALRILKSPATTSATPTAITIPAAMRVSSRT